MENETSGVVTPNVPVYWRVGDRNNSDVGLVTIQGTEGLGFLVAALQGVWSAVVVHRICHNNLGVKFRVRRAALNGQFDNIDPLQHIFVDLVQVDGWKAGRGIS